MENFSQLRVGLLATLIVFATTFLGLPNRAHAVPVEVECVPFAFDILTDIKDSKESADGNLVEMEEHIYKDRVMVVHRLDKTDTGGLIFTEEVYNFTELPVGFAFREPHEENPKVSPDEKINELIMLNGCSSYSRTQEITMRTVPQDHLRYIFLGFKDAQGEWDPRFSDMYEATIFGKNKSGRME